jgi:hypothetical protein
VINATRADLDEFKIVAPVARRWAAGRIVAVPISVELARVRNDKIVKNSDGNGVANVSQCIKFQHVPVLMSYVSILLTYLM